jgi:mannose-1-phosphate guanylyltransferase/phosphomannomutase
VHDAVDFAVSYRSLAEPIIAAIRARQAGGPVVVGICGRSRAGKSVIAHALARTLAEDGETALHVRLDDWIMPAAERGPTDTAEIRNRADRLPDIVAALRRREAVTAPGYNAATRVAGPPVTYDPAGHRIIVLDGVFAAHAAVRGKIDLTIFVESPQDDLRRRFAALYRWKGLDDAAMEELWRARIVEEWAAVDAQREHCNMILSIPASGP